MVAERAVGQQINDLRGELGVKFHEIENGDNGLKSLKSEIENEMSTLNDNLTDAFTQNNALLRREIQAMKDLSGIDKLRYTDEQGYRQHFVDITHEEEHAGLPRTTRAAEVERTEE